LAAELEAEEEAVTQVLQNRKKRNNEGYCGYRIQGINGFFAFYFMKIYLEIFWTLNGKEF
jgi:hypothetical protein